MRERIRDIRVAPDGNIYWLSDDAKGGLYRFVPPGEQLAGKSPGHNRSIRDLSVLLGTWTGESEFSRPDKPNQPPVRETSRTLCEAVLKGTYVQCSTTFASEDGRTRSILYHISYDPERRNLTARLIDSNWPGKTEYAVEFDARTQEWVGLTRTVTPFWPAADERITERISADGNRLEHREAIRIDSTSKWQRTFSWTWTRVQPEK